MILCLDGIKNVGSKSGRQGTLSIEKYRCDYLLPPFLSSVHMAMNANLFAPGNNAFYLRGTTRSVCLPLLWVSHPSRGV